MYFTIQRVCTLLVGIFFTCMGGAFIINSESMGATISGIVIALFGAYVIIASLIPHRSTSEVIGDEVILRVLIEYPLKMIVRLFQKLSDIF